MREIRWAVLGTGVIANEMAAALEKNGKNLVIFPVNQGKKWFQEKKIGNFQVCSLELSCVLAFYI